MYFLYFFLVGLWGCCRLGVSLTRKQRYKRYTLNFDTISSGNPETLVRYAGTTQRCTPPAGVTEQAPKEKTCPSPSHRRGREGRSFSAPGA